MGACGCLRAGLGHATALRRRMVGQLAAGEAAYGLLLAVDNSVLWFCTFSALLLYWCVVFSWAICCFCTSFFHLF